MTLHYQWLIRHDYLPRIVQKNVLDDVFTNGRKLVEPTATPTDVPTDAGGVLGRRVPARAQHGAAGVRLEPPLPRRRRAPCSTCSSSRRAAATSAATSGWPATGSRTGGGCTTSPAGGHPDARGAERRQQGAADRHAGRGSAAVPAASMFGEREQDVDFDDLVRNLAFRNLIRGVDAQARQRPADGRAAAARSGVGVEPLTRNQIIGGKGGAKLDRLDRRREGHRRWPARRCGSTSCARRRPATAGCAGSAAGSSPRRSTGRWRAAGSRSCATPTSRPTLGRGDTVRDDRPAVLRVRGKKSGHQPARRALIVLVVS